MRYMHGSLLGDAPGLGKTIQSIAALEFEKRILVFCPASLKYSWQEEIEKWEPNAVSIVIDGNKKERDILWACAEKGLTKNGVTKYPKYVIANYELLLRDLEVIMLTLWDAIICDEATRISNPAAKSVKRLKVIPAPKKIALTGTPVANTAVDLWSIIDWLRPGYLGNFFQFKKRFTITDGWGGIRGYKDLDVLAKKIEPFMLRRAKEEVMKDLPPKTSEKISILLSPKERRLYEAVIIQIAEEIKKLKIDGRTLPLIPVKMLRLKQLTGHPKILGSDLASSKFTALCDLLEPILKSDEKVIVFSQFAQMATLIQELLGDMGIKSLLIKGDVPARDRQTIIEDFRNKKDLPVLVMTEAGAYGLNLQVASYVIHYDLPWSVSKLTQREDRAHRIGQDKPVTVYSLIAKDTIDEYVQKVLYKKQKMSADVLQDVERMEESGLSIEDIQEILGIEIPH